MKKSLSTLAIAATVAVSAGMLFSSCNLAKDAIPAQKISWDGASADLVIPATSDTTAQGTVGTATLKYDLDSMIKAQTKDLPITLGANNIQSVKITKVTLTLNDADQNNNFGNFVYAALTFNTDVVAGSDPYNVAYIENNPNVYNASLDLPLQSPDQDVKQYFGNNVQFTYAMIAKLRRKTTKALHCHIDIKYDIEVKG